MSNLNKITVRKSDIKYRPCNACGTITAHIGDTDASRIMIISPTLTTQPFSTCLQCFVDSADTLEWSRWVDRKTGSRLSEPRGYKSPFGEAKLVK